MTPSTIFRNVFFFLADDVKGETTLYLTGVSSSTSSFYCFVWFVLNKRFYISKENGAHHRDFCIPLDEFFTAFFLDRSSSGHFVKTKMRTKGQRSPTPLKPDAERYVDIVDLGQTQAVAVPDPPDCVPPEATAVSRLALPLPSTCPSFSS